MARVAGCSVRSFGSSHLVNHKLVNGGVYWGRDIFNAFVEVFTVNHK
jgi:hypothetical protein